MAMPPTDRALVGLGRWLREAGYRFVTPTPATHARVNARASNATTTTLGGALGWSRPFREGALPAEAERLLRDADALTSVDGLLRCRVRFSSIGDDLFVHSAYPTHDPDAVFFGPDSYRFVSFLRRAVRPTATLVDIGAGSGAGGLSLLGRAERVILGDINDSALRYARINAEIMGAARATEVVHSDVLAGISGAPATVIANPPYMIDAAHRTYRDGGGPLGFALAVRIVWESLARLAPGGQLVLYTGSPVIDGVHPLRGALATVLADRPCRHSWEELDPDVFGEELETPHYQQVDRIAAVGLVVDMA